MFILDFKVFFKRPMYFLIFLFLFLFNLLSFQSSYAAENNAAGSENLLGTIDMLAVYAYHPSMQYYDYDKGLFIRPIKLNATINEFNNLIKSRFDEQEKTKSQLRNDFQKMNADIDSLSKRLNDIDSKKAGEIYQINQSGSEEMSKMKEVSEREKKVKIIQEEIAKIENKYLKEKQEITASLEKALAASEELKLNVLKIHYMTPSETEKEFEKINKQIDEAIKYSMNKKNVKFLLNLSHFSGQKLNGNISDKSIIPPSAQSSIDTAVAPSYTMISEFFNSLEAPAGDLKNIEAQKKAKKELYSKIFNERYKLTKINSKHINNNLVIAGGVDITMTVIFYNLKDAINREKAEYIQQVLKEYGFVD